MAVIFDFLFLPCILLAKIYCSESKKIHKDWWKSNFFVILPL